MLQLLLAILPFVLVVYLLLVRGVRADFALFFTYVFTGLTLLLFWQESLMNLFFSSVQGVLLAIDVILIILGVLMVFSLLDVRGSLKHLEDFFMSISSEVHVHIILMGFFLVMFLEGIAGFGIPALIVAPLLVLVGVKKLSAIVIALFSDSIAVMFGAFGTPMVVGFAEVSSLSSVVFFSALVGGVLMVFAPLVLLGLHTFLEKGSFSDMKKFIPFALCSGVISAVVFFLSAWLLGPELPSVLASLVGLVSMVVLLRTRVFAVRIRKPRVAKALPALFSYLLIVVVLVVSRLDVFGVGSFLRNASFVVSGSEFSHAFSAYHPGALILGCFVVLLLCLRPSKKQFSEMFDSVAQKSFRVIVTLVFTLMFVQLIIRSPDPSVPFLLAQSFSATGEWYVFFATLLGAFGSFVAGSATVSNLLLFSLHLDAAAINGLSESVVLSAQALGAGAGNLIAIHNILAVLAVVHIKDGMRKVLRVNGVLAVVICVLSASLLFFVLGLGLT